MKNLNARGLNLKPLNSFPNDAFNLKKKEDSGDSGPYVLEDGSYYILEDGSRYNVEIKN